MPVIARDAVASDHLVYAWPFPIGPEEYEVACAEDELVVMCPAWMVGDRLGPGRHRWRTPDPMRPVSAYFVLTAPVEVDFDMMTTFVMPSSGQPIRLRATGSLQVRCLDPALLVAQFVGLPFDHVNDGVLRSVSRSIERMLARLLTRRVVMAGTPNAVTDPSMLQNIVEELIAYNPAAGAVFGVELVRFGHLSVMADDGSRPWQQMANLDWSGSQRVIPSNGGSNPNQQFPPERSRPDAMNLLETVRGMKPTEPPPPAPSSTAIPPPIPSGLFAKRAQTQPGADRPSEASGEIVQKPKKTTTAPGHAAAPNPTTPSLPAVPPPPATTPSALADVPPLPHRVITTPVPSPRRAGSLDAQSDDDDITRPGDDSVAETKNADPGEESRGSIMGIGVSGIGSGSVSSGGSSGGVASGEITRKIAPGARVLVPGPNGLMQSATVRQLLQGYYELEVGGSGETIWVPINGVVPE